MSRSSVMLLTICTSLVAILSVSEALQQRFQLPTNAIDVSASGNQLKINLIDVECDKDQDGMLVTIEFEQPFGGVIYSQGFFSNPKCRYVAVGQNQQSYSFIVPYRGCGSKPSCAICDSIDNVLVIQQDEELQGQFDVARKISCSRSGIEEEKKVFFKPFIVDMLEVVTISTSNGGVDCWMDIQRGIYPQLTAIGEVIKIGEELTVLVYLRDEKREYDLTVRNCWAYDNEDFDVKTTGKVQLSDASGCSSKKKLFGLWQKTTQTGSSGATLLMHNTLRAFKFPDEGQVYLKCDIEICRGNCAEAICDDSVEVNEIPNIPKHDCTSDPFNPKCVTIQIMSKSTSPMPRVKPKYEISSTNRTPIQNIPKIPVRPFIAITTRPTQDVVTTDRFTYIPVTDGFVRTTQKPFLCTPSSNDIKCIQQQRTEPTIIPKYNEFTTYVNTYRPIVSTTASSQPSFCKVYPKDLRCIQVTTATEDIVTDYPTKIPIKCYPGSLDSRCSKESVEILTFRPQSTTITTPTTQPIRCYLGSLDPRCLTDQYTTTDLPKSLNCFTNPSDSRCKQFVTTTDEPATKSYPTTPAPQCYPGSTDKRCLQISTTSQPVICKLGSVDSRCPKPTSPPTYVPPLSTEKTTAFATPSTPTSSKITFSTTNVPTTLPQLRCYPGSLDTRCLKAATTRLPPASTTRRTSPTVSTQKTDKIFICLPGSNDINCVSTGRPTTEISTAREEFTTIPPILPSIKCYSGSLDARCPKVITTTSTPLCYQGSLDPRCSKDQYTTKSVPKKVTTQLTKKPICYLGSPNPECQQFSTEILTLKPRPSTTPLPIRTTTQSIRCYPGTLDPRCPSVYTTKTVTAEPPTRLNCFLNPKDPRCKQTIEITTTEEPETEIFTTTATYRCYPGSPDIRCPQITSTREPLVCKPGLLDPRCPNPTPTAKPPTYLPPVSTIKTTTKSEKFTYSTAKPSTITASSQLSCYPGSLDPRCPKITTTKSLPTLTTKTTESSFKCYPGSNDIRCEPSVKSTTEVITTPKVVTSTQPQIRCYPGSLDPRCPRTTTPKSLPTFTTRPTIPSTTTKRTTEKPFNCYPGSNDIRCNLTTRPITEATTTPELIIITSTLPPIQCYLGSLDPRCPQTTTTKSPSTFTTRTTQQPTATKRITETPFKCYPGLNDIRCNPATRGTTKVTSTPKVISTTITPTLPPIRCYPGSLDPRCPKVTTTTSSPLCYQGSLDPRCSKDQYTTKSVPKKVTAQLTKKPICYLGSPNPECQQVSTEIHTLKPRPSTTPLPIRTTTQSIRCYPGTLDPRCPSVYTTKTVTAEPPTRLNCFLNPKDPRCKQTIEITTTEEPETEIFTTTATYRCFPGSPDIRCPQITSTREPLVCKPGLLDPRCPNPTPTAKPPTYLPPVSTIKTTTKSEKFTYSTAKPSTITASSQLSCYPGSLDPRCPKITTTKSLPTLTTRPTIPSTTTKRTTEKPFNCYPGSNDIRCNLTTRPITEATTTPELIIITSTLPPIRCYPGSLDPRCPKITTTKSLPTLTTKATESSFKCYPGSNDIRCEPSVKSTTEVITTPKVVTSTQPQIRCYPGSLDPRCPRTTTPKSLPTFTTRPTIPSTTTKRTTEKPFNCYPGSNDIRCNLTTRPITEATTTPELITITSTLPPIRCYPGSLDPRCPETTTTKTLVTSATTKPSPAVTTDKPFRCHPRSNDIRCESIFKVTNTLAPTTTRTTPPANIETTPPLSTARTTQPQTTTERKIITTFTTPKAVITSSKLPLPTYTTLRTAAPPKPFNTRSPFVTSTTENPLCYPGSTIPGCASSLITPAFCYPGSPDKRCPQLPKTFSTRQPATYLPPFPDSIGKTVKNNRVKREHTLFGGQSAQEIVKFSLSFKGYSFVNANN